MIFQNHCPSWILNGPWYNNTICSRLYGLVFGDYLTTAKREIYNLSSYFEAHEKNHKSVNKHKPINDETSSGGFRPTPSTLREETLKLFGRTLKFIEIWLQLFKVNCEN